MDLPASTLALIERLYVLGEVRRVLDLSEDLRRAGYMSPKLAVLQALCLDQLGQPVAAMARLDELERAAPDAGPLLEVVRRSVGDGRSGAVAQAQMRTDAMRFLPKLEPKQ